MYCIAPTEGGGRRGAKGDGRCERGGQCPAQRNAAAVVVTCQIRLPVITSVGDERGMQLDRTRAWRMNMIQGRLDRRRPQPSGTPAELPIEK